MIVLGEKLSICIEVWYYNYKKFATIPLCEDGGMILIIIL